MTLAALLEELKGIDPDTEFDISEWCCQLRTITTCDLGKPLSRTASSGHVKGGSGRSRWNMCRGMLPCEDGTHISHPARVDVIQKTPRLTPPPKPCWRHTSRLSERRRSDEPGCCRSRDRGPLPCIPET